MFAIDLAASKSKRARRAGWDALLLAAAMLSGASLAGCDLSGSEEDATGSYSFENSYGYAETIVLQPGRWEELQFSVAGQVDLQDVDGALSGTGTCTRTSVSIQHPEGEETRTEETLQAVVSGMRSGSKLTNFRISGCAYPRAMIGALQKGRIVLDTDLDFPVSRGTTVISDRFGDPSSLVMNRSED